MQCLKFLWEVCKEMMVSFKVQKGWDESEGKPVIEALEPILVEDFLWIFLEIFDFEYRAEQRRGEEIMNSIKMEKDCDGFVVLANESFLCLLEKNWKNFFWKWRFGNGSIGLAGLTFFKTHALLLQKHGTKLW